MTTSMPEGAPLSLTQRSSLLMAPFNPSREFMSWVYQLNGKLDVGALARALDDVVEALDVLRVRLVRGADGNVETARQFVTPFRAGVLRIVALDDRPKLDALAAAVHAVDVDYSDLDPWDEPRLTATLYVVSPKTHVLAIFVAEALVDGESGTLVAAELSRAYAHHAGRTPPVPDPPDGAGAMGVADGTGVKSYVAWVEENPVSEAAAQRALEHWRRLHDEPVAAGSWPMELDPTRRPSTRFFNVPAAHWARLEETTPGLTTMPFVVVLSWVEMALARLVGAERFLVTSAVSNRSRAGAKGVVGNFVGPVRLLAEVRSEDTLADVSPRVLVSLREAMAASVVPVPLAEARMAEPGTFSPPVPTVSFFMFTEREGPDLAGVRQRRFRLNSGKDVLRVNCTPDETGGRNFFVISGSAPDDLVDALVAELRGFLGMDPGSSERARND